MWRPLLLSLPLLFSQSLAALPHITAKGAKFFTSDGAQFFIKGDFGAWLRIGPFMQY